MRSFICVLALYILQGCSHVFYQPSPKHFLDPAQFKLKFQDVSFKSGDGTKLHGWFFPAKSGKPKGTIIQFHGNAQNISTHFFSLVWLIDHDYNLFTFDYRGYAKSEGKPDQAGVYLDCLTAIEKGREFNQRHGGGKLIVYGQSLGAAILLRTLPDSPFYKSDVAVTVIDSGFASYQDIAFDKLSSNWALFLVSPLSYLLVSDEYAADKVYQRITGPTLVIVGQKDSVIPPKFGKKIFKGISTKKKWLWKLPDGSHIDVFHHNKGQYRQQFLDFLDKQAL